MTCSKIMGGIRAWQRAQKGGSLLEMTIAMTLGAVILVSLFTLYYTAAATAAKEESRAAATTEGRMVAMKFVRDIRLMGLFATEDVDGDSNDIDTDVEDMTWSDGLHEGLECASTYLLAFSCDVDNDSLTETIEIRSNDNGYWYDLWKWDRDSTQWGATVSRRYLGENIDKVIFRFFDNNGDEVPQSGPIPVGGYTLTRGQRMTVTAVEVTVVVRGKEEANQSYRNFVHLPDGTYWYDNFHREVYRFMVRGRNLNLDV